MEKFDFKFKAGFGLHARPAGMLVKTANEFDSNITVIKEKDGNRASAKGLFALLGLKIEGSDTVSVEAEGSDELEAIGVIKTLFENDFKISDSNAVGAESVSSESIESSSQNEAEIKVHND